ncbi:MAG: penicillin acylase family protein [Angustibacter sp.]
MPRLHAAVRAAVVLCAALLVVTVVGAGAVVSAVRRPFPERGGTVDVPGLSAPVRVLRDGRGVPQLYAENAADLFMAQGYVHAQDRFFEMDLRRHVTAGRLSELVGASEDALAADRAIRTMGWRRVAERELSLLSTSTRQHLQAYAAGVNAYLVGRSPSELAVEYAILDLRLPDYQVEPWTPVDSIAWLKAMAWDLKSNYADEVTRARLSAFLSPSRIEQLYPDPDLGRSRPILSEDDIQLGREQADRRSSPSAVPAQWASPAPSGGPARPVPSASSSSRAGTAAPVPTAPVAAARQALGSAQLTLDAVPALLGRGADVGSNSWVVSGDRTTTGKPLLANDPHLAPRMPSIWYQVGLHCTRRGPSCPFEVAGFGFSGVPGVIIGHTDRVAWGFTNLAPDVTDLYLERIVGNRVEVDGEYQDLATRTETIRVRGGPDVPLTIRETRHGPLLSDVSADARDAGRDLRADQQNVVYDVALSWTALRPGRSMDAVFGLGQATDWASFRDAARSFEVPSQNLVYADVDGNTGYQAPGRIPVRQGYDGRWPVPGWDSRYRWASFVPFDELPAVLNPSEGFIVAANQTVSAQPRPFLTRDWSHGYRAGRITQRIREVLSTGQRVSAADMAAIQSDTRNPMAAVLIPALLRVDLSGDEFSAEAQGLLRDWDLTQPTDSAAAAYYNAVWRTLLRLTFDDELGPDVGADGADRWFTVVTRLLDRPQDRWWDDRGTPSVREGRDEILRQALRTARVDLTQSLGKDVARWRWSRLHRLELTHTPLGGDGVPGPVRALVNRGPYPVGGGQGTVTATGWDPGAGYEVVVAPSMRMVVDLADWDRSTWVNLTGASGHPFDAHYDDQVDRWATGRSYSWPFTARAVQDAADQRQTLRPPPGPRPGEGRTR